MVLSLIELLFAHFPIFELLQNICLRSGFESPGYSFLKTRIVFLNVLLYKLTNIPSKFD